MQPFQHAFHPYINHINFIEYHIFLADFDGNHIINRQKLKVNSMQCINGEHLRFILEKIETNFNNRQVIFFSLLVRINYEKSVSFNIISVSCFILFFCVCGCIECTSSEQWTLLYRLGIIQLLRFKPKFAFFSNSSRFFSLFKKQRHIFFLSPITNRFFLFTVQFFFCNLFFFSSFFGVWSKSFYFTLHMNAINRLHLTIMSLISI